MVLGYQVTRDYSVFVGTPQDQAYVRNFHARLDDSGHPFRWSDVYGYVLFPGLGGSRPFTLTMDLDPGRTAPVTAIVNSEPFFTETLQPGWHTVVLRVDASRPAALGSRDTVVEFRAPDYRDPDLPSEAKGLKVSRVRLEQATQGGFVVPSYATLGYLLGGMLILYVLVGRSLLGFAGLSRARLWALAVLISAGLALCLALARNHVIISAAAPHMVTTFASALVLLIICERFLLSRVRILVPSQKRVLAVCVALAFALRYGGMA